MTARWWAKRRMVTQMSYPTKKTKTAENPGNLRVSGLNRARQVKRTGWEQQLQATKRLETTYWETGDGIRTDDGWGPELIVTEQEPPVVQETGDRTATSDKEDGGEPEGVDGPAPAACSDEQLKRLGAAEEAAEAGADNADKGPGCSNEHLRAAQTFSNSASISKHSADEVESSLWHLSLGSKGITSCEGTKSTAETTGKAAEYVTTHATDDEVVVTTIEPTGDGR